MLIAGKYGKYVHQADCPWLHHTREENLVYFKSNALATESKYFFCPKCSIIANRMRYEADAINTFAKQRNFQYRFIPYDGSLYIITAQGQWKIMAHQHIKNLFLYHKNTYDKGKKGLLPGYHYQKVRRSTILEYLEYIAQHERYRMDNPLSIPKPSSKEPPKKMSKKQRRQEENIKRKKDIRRVINKINKLSVVK